MLTGGVNAGVVAVVGPDAASLIAGAGEQIPVEGRLFPTQWNGDNALVLMANIAAKTAVPRVEQFEPGADRLSSHEAS